MKKCLWNNPRDSQTTIFLHMFFCLKHALYGLKQLSRMWFHRFREFLLTFGFHGSLSDPSLFIYHKEDLLAYFLVYVDDMFVTGSTSMLVQHVVNMLSKEFAVQNLEHVKYFPRFELQKVSTWIKRNILLICRSLVTLTNSSLLYHWWKVELLSQSQVNVYLILWNSDR